MMEYFMLGLVVGSIFGLVAGFVIVLSQCEYNHAENKMWLRWSKPLSNSERTE